MNVSKELSWRIDELEIETGDEFSQKREEGKGCWLERNGEQMGPLFEFNHLLLDYVDGVLQGVRLGKASHLGDT